MLYILQAFPIPLQASNNTHVSLTLSIENATADDHSGTYQCRATDGNSSDHCGARAGASAIPACVPTTTISTPARIQIVGEIHTHNLDYMHDI